MCEYDLVTPVTSKCKDHSATSPATITTLTATTTASKTTTVSTISTATTTITATTTTSATTTLTTSERKAQGDDTTTTEKSISNKIVFIPLASIYTVFFGLLL